MVKQTPSYLVTIILVLSVLTNIELVGEIKQDNAKFVNEKSTPSQFMENGTFINTGMKGKDQNLTNWPISNGAIVPLLERADTSTFLFQDTFNNQSNGPPNDWNCGSEGVVETSGKAHFTAGGQATENAYCHIDLNHLSLNQTGKATFHFRTWVKDGYEHYFRGVKLYGLLSDERNFFVMMEDNTSELILTTNYQTSDGTWIVTSCPTGVTSIPQPSLQVDFHDWHILADSVQRHFWLYQDGILRCEFDYQPVANNGLGHMMEIGSWGSFSDTSAAQYDKVAATVGWVPFQTGGTWISPPLEKDPDYEWGSLDLDWQWYGIGNFQDVRETIRLTVLDWRDNTPIEGFTNLRPTSNFLNISSIPHNIPLKIQIDWLPNITADLIALSAINYQSGELRPLDLEMDSLSASGANSVAPILLRSEFYAHRMQGYQRDIDIGISIENGRNYSTTFNSSLIDSMHWGGWFNENYSALSAGLYNLTVTLDPNNEWDEENEDNNQLTTFFYVSPSSGPNITLVNNPDVGEQAIFEIEPTVEGLDIEYLWLQWDVGDGELIQIPYQFVITHIYNIAGNHTLSLFAFHQNNQTTSYTTLDFQIGNTPPIANISVSQPWPALAQVVRLSCENSTDTPGEELTCEWLIEEGLPAENHGQWIVGETIIHRYPNLGEKHVTLRVTDPFGASDIVEANFTLEAQETRQLLIGVETNSSAVFEGSTIMVRPIWNPNLNASERENVSLIWMQEGVGIFTTKNATGWHSLPAGTANGLNAGSVLSQLQVGLETEYDLTNFYYTVLNRPPEIFVQTNIVNPLYEDEQFIIDWSGSIDDEWDTLSARIWFEPDVEFTIIEDTFSKKFSISIPKSSTYQMTLEVSDGTDTDSLTIPIIVVNKQPEIKVKCTSKSHGETADVLCLITEFNESPSDIGSLTISWDSPWVQRTGMEFEVLGIEPGNPNRGENEYVIYYEVIDDDGARSNGYVYVQINTTSNTSFGSTFEFNVLKFPLFAFLGMFIIGGLISYISNRKKPNEVGSKEWFKQNPWSQELNQSDKIISEDDEENTELDD